MSEITQFAGFPAEGIQFLVDLAENNGRDWFQAHKKTYQECLLRPAQSFVQAMGERLKTISRGIQFDTATSGRGSIMRIYRDTRFSKDKTPYYTYLRVMFWEGAGKKMENPGFMLWIDPAGAGMYAGMYSFTKSQLESYRDAVVDETMGSSLIAAIDAVRSAGDYEIGGAHYKRAPRGYDADHERVELLKHNGLWAKSPAIEPALMTTPELVDACFAHCHNAAPLHRWLLGAV